jgi:glycosyltransferase involved in cell wall biosynthesis
MHSQRLAIVHEWVAARAGSEQVFEALAQLYPEADLHALTVDPSVPLDVQGRSIRTTFLDRPGLRDKRGAVLPLMPLAWRMMGNSDHDVVLMSHHAFAATNRLGRPGAARLAYVHTPARYVWTPELDGRGTSPFLAPARRALGSMDRRAASRLTSVAANSREVAHRIRAFWQREARVIHPPVDTDYFAQPAQDVMDLPTEFVLGLGRWIPYKNHLLVIEVAELAGIPAVIAGAGPLAAQLRARAAKSQVPVLVLERPAREEVRELFRRATVLMFPTEEDFGIVPVEAMAAGTPVVAYAKGGATETVVEGASGVLVAEHSAHAYLEGIRRARDIPAMECRINAQRFSRPRFDQEILNWVAEFTHG